MFNIEVVDYSSLTLTTIILNNSYFVKFRSLQIFMFYCFAVLFHFNVISFFYELYCNAVGDLRDVCCLCYPRGWPGWEKEH